MTRADRAKREAIETRRAHRAAADARWLVKATLDPDDEGALGEDLETLIENIAQFLRHAEARGERFGRETERRRRSR